MRVLVTDANNRVSLAVVRALGAHDCEVNVVTEKHFASNILPASYSKYVKKRFIVSSWSDITKFADNVDVVIPISINTILVLAKDSNRYKSKLPLAPLETIRKANNKDYLVNFASAVGIKVPKTYLVRKLEELDATSKILKFPLVIKLRNDEGLYLEPQFRYKIVYDAQVFRKEYMELHKRKEFPIVQEYIQGAGYGFSALCNNGKPLAIFCHKRIREYPASGGPSATCISVFDKELTESGIKLLKALKWHGIAMVEFKKDISDGSFKLMELNPRFWGALPLAINCGVNFPYLLCKMASGENVEPVMTYKVGQKLRFMFLDAASVFSSLGTGKFCQYSSGFIKDLANPNIKDGIFNCDDVRPGMAYLAGKIL